MFAVLFGFGIVCCLCGKLTLSIEDELSVCHLFNKCYKKLIVISGLPATSSLKRLEYGLSSVWVLDLVLAHSGKAKAKHYKKVAFLHAVPSF